MIIKAGENGQFLKATDVTETMKAEILGVESAEGSEFSDYFLKMKIGKELFTLGLKASSGNVNALVSAFGENTSKWEGKKLKFTTGVYKGKTYVKVIPC